MENIKKSDLSKEGQELVDFVISVQNGDFSNIKIEVIEKPNTPEYYFVPEMTYRIWGDTI